MEPHKKRGAGLAADSPRLQPLLIKCCQILRLVRRPFASVFWWLEQRIAALDLEIEKGGGREPAG
jgi:hypothetical protein